MFLVRHHGIAFVLVIGMTTKKSAKPVTLPPYTYREGTRENPLPHMTTAERIANRNGTTTVMPTVVLSDRKFTAEEKEAFKSLPTLRVPKLRWR